MRRFFENQKSCVPLGSKGSHVTFNEKKHFWAYFDDFFHFWTIFDDFSHFCIDFDDLLIFGAQAHVQ